jgi:hypothetical protein
MMMPHDMEMSKGFQYVVRQSEGMFWVLAFPAVYLFIYFQSVKLQKW